MPERVRVAQMSGEPGRLRITPVERIDRGAGDGLARTLATREEIWVLVIPALPQERAQVAFRARKHWVVARLAPFQPRDANLPSGSPTLDVVEANERRLAASEGVAIDHIEEQAVANLLGRDGREKGFRLFLRHEGERQGRREWHR